MRSVRAALDLPGQEPSDAHLPVRRSARCLGEHLRAGRTPVHQREDERLKSDDAISVVTDNTDLATRTVDVLSRAALGIALEGLMVSITVSRGEQELVDE